MNWALNTTKPCTVAEIEADLLGELDHFTETQPAAIARREVPDYQTTNNDLKEPVNLARITKAIEDERRPIIARAVADLQPVTAQMKTAIASAAAVAKSMAGTTFQVTIAGHFDEDHSDGITERINISVDVAS